MRKEVENDKHFKNLGSTKNNNKKSVTGMFSFKPRYIKDVFL